MRVAKGTPTLSFHFFYISHDPNRLGVRIVARVVSVQTFHVSEKKEVVGVNDGG